MKSARRTIRILLVLWTVLLLAGCREGAPAAAIPAAGTVRPYPTAVPAITEASQDIPRISVDQLWQRLQGGESIVVVDSRSRDEYNIEHIAGAISLPEQELAARANELPRDSLLVFYCT